VQDPKLRYFKPFEFFDHTRSTCENFANGLSGKSIWGHHQTRPFDPQDETLLSAAGSCARCPKRTGNNRCSFPKCGKSPFDS